MPRPVITSPHRKRRMNQDRLQIPSSKASRSDGPGSRRFQHDGWQAVSPWLNFASQFELHSIISNAHVDATLGGHGPEFRTKLALVAGHNLRAAMRDDGSRYAFFFAPRQLGTNRRMANERLVASSNERARHSSTIANIDLHAVQRCTALVNEDEVARIENARAPGAHTISDRRGENGMFDRERFKCDPTNFRRRTLFDHMAILDRVMPQFLPRFFRRIYRRRRAAFQSPRMIGMGVREHDRAGTDAFQFSQPIKTAIDHHICTAIRSQQRRMHTMSPRARVDLAACA